MKIETSHQEKPERIIPPSVFPYFAEHKRTGLVVMFISEFAGVVVDQPNSSSFRVGDVRTNWTSINDNTNWLACDTGYSATFTQDR